MCCIVYCILYTLFTRVRAQLSLFWGGSWVVVYTALRRARRRRPGGVSRHPGVQPGAQCGCARGPHRPGRIPPGVGCSKFIFTRRLYVFMHHDP